MKKELLGISRVIVFVSLFLFMGSPCFADPFDRNRDPAWDQVYNSTGIGFGAVNTPTGWQPMMDVSAFDLQGEHGFISFEGRFSLGSADTMGGSRDGKMNYSQLNLLVGVGKPWLQVGTGIVHVSTDLGVDSLTFSVPYQSYDPTRKVAYSATSAPLLIKIVPLRTDYHYLSASVMACNLSSAASADIPITLNMLDAHGHTTVKGNGGITTYAEISYKYRLTNDIRRKGWLLYVKGFYETAEAKNLNTFDVPAEFAGVGNAKASVPDLKWQMQGVLLGISLEL